MLKARTRLLLAPALLLLAGCYEGYYYYGELDIQAQGPIIEVTPPAPIVEEIPPEPFAGAVWVAGYWSWSGSRYVWVRGRYMRPPQPGLAWYPGGYVRRGPGYVYVPGRWVAPGWRPRYSYLYGNIQYHPRYRSYYYYHPGPYYGPHPAGGHYHYGPAPGRGYHQRGPHPSGGGPVYVPAPPPGSPAPSAPAPAPGRRYVPAPAPGGPAAPAPAPAPAPPGRVYRRAPRA